MFITPSFKKSLIVEQFQGNYLKMGPLPCRFWSRDFATSGWDDVSSVGARNGDLLTFIHTPYVETADLLTCNGFLSKDCRKLQLNFRTTNTKLLKGYLFDKASIRLVIE